MNARTIVSASKNSTTKGKVSSRRKSPGYSKFDVADFRVYGASVSKRDRVAIIRKVKAAQSGQ